MPYLRVLMLFEQWQEYQSEMQENEYDLNEKMIDIN
jgi:hypothetical protein